MGGGGAGGRASWLGGDEQLSQRDASAAVAQAEPEGMRHRGTRGMTISEKGGCGLGALSSVLTCAPSELGDSVLLS